MMILGKEGLSQLVQLYFHSRQLIKHHGSERWRKEDGY